jgi:membrane protein DedA with SNARE-associated domain
MAKMKKSYKIIITLIVFLIIWTIIFTQVDLPGFIERIGIANGYLIALGVALLGGVSTLTTASFFTTIGALSIAGLDPLLLGLVCAPALALGDFIFYFLGLKGRDAVGHGFKNKILKIERWFDRHPRWFRPAGIYVYTAFTPFPADILMVALAFIEYKFRKALPWIILGHITIITWLGYVAKLTNSVTGLGN